MRMVRAIRPPTGSSSVAKRTFTSESGARRTGRRARDAGRSCQCRWLPALEPFFLESSFQDPCPTLNGTRRATIPQVLTRRSEPITLLAKRGRLHLQTQKLALVVITQEAEAHSHGLTARSHPLQARAGACRLDGRPCDELAGRGSRLGRTPQPSGHEGRRGPG